jgi:diguanylate cyclase (GGDEF)-like protein/PAS domain S-box-containing protein
MQFDIPTLSITLIIASLLQVIGLYIQYRLDKTNHGLGWWVLGSAAVGLAFFFNALESQALFGRANAVIDDALFISGLALIYIGVLNFYQIPRQHKRMLVAFCLAVSLLSFYFTFIQVAPFARQANIYLTCALLSFLIAGANWQNKHQVPIPANLLAGFFLLFGVFFLFRGYLALTGKNAWGQLDASSLNALTFMVTLVFSTLWTFGIIIMANQRLNADNLEARESMHLFFNTNPDAVLISRLADGKIVDLNHGFSNLTGYSRSEVLGKTTDVLGLWKNPPDRTAFFNRMRESGSCQNLEAVFIIKDGSLRTGMISANTLILKGVAHVISVTRDISELKQAEDERRSSDDWLRTLSLAIEQSPVTTVLTDLQGNILFTNPKFTESTGYTPEEALGQNSRILKTGEMPAAGYKELWDTILAGNNWHGVFHNRRKNGELYWESAVISPVKNREGVTTHFLALKEDITDRMQAEEALRLSEARYRAVARTANEAIISADYRGNIVSWNKGAEAIFGYTEAEALGLPVTAIMPTTLREGHPANLLRVQNGGEKRIIGKTVEVDGYRKDGSLVPLEKSLSEWSVDNSLFYTAIIRDVTERKKVEDALRNSEERLRAIFDVANTGISIMDLTGRYVMFNDHWLESLGYGSDEVRQMTNLDITHPDDRENSAGWFRKLVRGEVQRYRLEKRHLKKDGTVIWVDLSVSGIKDQNGKLVNVVGIVNDITGRKQLEEHLRQIAITDELTGCFNRRHMQDLARAEIKRALRHNRPLSMALIDIDYFKSINDNYGHAVGDRVLQIFSEICRTKIRSIDIFARLGGDEFAVLLPEADLDHAYDILERIRMAFFNKPLETNAGVITLSISCGIASLAGGQEDFDQLLHKADQSLYRAKEAGRNQVSK